MPSDSGVDAVVELSLFDLHIFHKGKKYAKKKEYEEAIECFQRCLSACAETNRIFLHQICVTLADTHVIVVNEVGKAEEAKKKHGNEAVNLYEKVIKIFSEENEHDKIIATKYKLGNAYFALGKKDEAFLQYSEIVSSEDSVNEPTHSPFLEKISSVGFGREVDLVDVSEALESAYQELKKDYLLKENLEAKKKPLHVDQSTFAQMTYNYALLQLEDKAYFVSNKYLESVYRYKSLLTPDPLPRIHNFDVLYHLGKSYFHSGYKYWAVVLLETFLREYDPNHPNSKNCDKGSIHVLLAELYETNHPGLALNQCFKYLANIGNLNDQNPKKIIHHKVRDFPSSESHVLDVFKKMGDLFYEENKFYLAAHCLREMYEVSSEINLGEENVDLLEKIYSCYNQIHVAEILDDKVWVLEELIGTLEGMREACESTSEMKVAEYCKTLGMIFIKKKFDVSGGINYLHRYLDSIVKHTKPGSPKIAKIKAMIGSYYVKEGNLDKALRMCKDAEESAILAKSDKLRVQILCMLGSIWVRKSEEASAVESLEKALQLKRAQVGHDHLDVTPILTLFGSVFYEFGLYNASVNYCLEAFSILNKYKGQRAKCVKVLQYVVNGYKHLEFYDSALKTCTKILKIQEELHHSICVQKALTLETMGDVHFQRGRKNDYVNAAELYRESLCMIRKEDAETKILELYTKMATALLHLGRTSIAAKTYTNVLHIVRSNPSDARSISLLDALQGQGDVLFAEKRYERALDRYQKTLRFLEKLEETPTDNDRSTSSMKQHSEVVLLLKIGRTHSRMRIYPKAIRRLTKGFSMLEKDEIVSLVTCHYMYEFGLACVGMGDAHLAIDYFGKASHFLDIVSDLEKKNGHELKTCVSNEMRKARKSLCSLGLLKTLKN